MLLYVDKKKQKRKKIKITSFILTFIFIVLANILHFNKTLHQTDAHLTEYQNIKTTHDWFYSSDTIQIFTKKNKQTPLIIIIPQKITRENAEIFAYALTLANKHTSIKLSSSIANNNILQTIAEHIIPQNQLINYSEYLLITNDIKDANEIIYKEKL